MRTLAIGDIHGCLAALETILAAVKPERDDRIVTLGDYIDRGPSSCQVIERVLQLRESLDVTCLIGNHEVMLQAAREDDEFLPMWLGHGGREALQSYAPDKEADELSLEVIPERHWEFVDTECLPYHETKNHIFVHAGVLPDVPLPQQDDATLYWEKFTNRGPHYTGKTVICGHTAQKSGWPNNVGHTICIDTWVYGEGWLTCLDCDTGHFWQANQAGQLRQGQLA